MAVTIHVNGTSNSLVHQGSGGIAKNTPPDVCKTPSPGGPVPVPYPVIVSRSSDLVKGTKTVKVDGGKMAAVKGSEFSRCVGDESGTVGGVASNTNRAEAKWLLCSFDVKLEGKGACRLGDKMTMNHGNTACMSGVLQTPVGKRDVVPLRCEPGWSDCQKQQMVAKTRAMDAAAKKQGFLKTRSTAGRLRKAADSWAKKFARDWNKPSPTGWPAFSDPAGQPAHFYADCAKTDDPLGNDMQADHALEVQLGGNVKGPFIWLDAAVNSASGRQIKQARERGITEPTGFEPVGCD